MLFNLTQADAFALLQHFLGFSKPKHDPSVLVCEDLSTWRNVSLFPSVHLSLTRLSDVGACNFHHRHTFVSVCTVNNCSPPTRTFPYKRISCICREEKKNHLVLLQRESSRHPLQPFPPFIWVTFTRRVWMVVISVSWSNHTIVCAGISINPPAASSFDCRLKLTATQFCHPACPPPPPPHLCSHSSVLPLIPHPLFFFFLSGSTPVQIFRLWLLKEFTALSLPIWSQ